MKLPLEWSKKVIILGNAKYAVKWVDRFGLRASGPRRP